MRNKLAEIFEKYTSKGDKIYVEGRLKPRSWQDENNVTRYTVEVYVSEFTFLSNRKDTPQTDSQGNASQPEMNNEDSDLPF